MRANELAELAMDADQMYPSPLVQVLIGNKWYNVTTARVIPFHDSEGASYVLALESVPVVKENDA